MNKYKSHGGGPAFPPMHDPRTHDHGMTLREWLTGQALAGLMANPNHTLRFEPDQDAVYCLAVADAILSKLGEVEDEA